MFLIIAENEERSRKMGTNNETNGRGDAPNPDFVDWKFASEEDREKLREWVLKAAIGEKPLPLIIVGPKASGKSRLLGAIGRIIGSCNVMLPPRGFREEYELWAALQSSSYVGIDDCWERNSERIENCLQGITLGKGFRYRVPYTTDKIGEFKANAALAVAVCAKSEDRVVAIKNDYPHLRPLTLVRLAV